MNIVLSYILLGNLLVTSYRSVPGQTDNSPFQTSTGERVSITGAAISQDLLCGACRKMHRRCNHPEYNKKLHYGDCLYIDGIGIRIINDCMGLRKHWMVKTNKGRKKVFKDQKMWVDIWVISYHDEHYFHKKFGINKHKIYKIEVKNELF